jgi:hypothetical protein
MTAGAGCKFTVHFSTSFSTTRISSRKMLPIALAAELNHSRFRHFLYDFGGCGCSRFAGRFEQANCFLP